jgi:PD-(D/E)XK nuclease superfamily
MTQIALGLDEGFAQEVERGPGRPKRYIAADGQEVKSATTIAGRFKDPGGLYWWHWDRGRRGVEFNDYSSDGALDIGSLVHKIIETEIAGGTPPPVPPEYRANIESALNSWREWFLAQQLTIIATEVPLVSEEYRFGGTVDAMVLDRHGQVCVADWKTSGGIYSEALLQVAAYRILWEENRGPVDGGFHIVRFSKEYGDFAHRYYANLDDAREMFLHLVPAYTLAASVKKRIG